MQHNRLTLALTMQIYNSVHTHFVNKVEGQDYFFMPQCLGTYLLSMLTNTVSFHGLFSEPKRGKHPCGEVGEEFGEWKVGGGKVE